MALIKKAKSVKATKPGRRNLRTALVLKMKQQAQTLRGSKVKGQDFKKATADIAGNVPPKQRAGYPLVKTKVKPEDWVTDGGKQVFVDLGRCNWLPDDWGQGVKLTNPIARSRPGHGGTYTVFVSPCGRVFYHKWAIEDFIGRELTFKDGVNGQMRQAQLQGKVTAEKDFFQLLSAKERKVLPSADALHFCVVSARRTSSPEGVQGICTVEALFKQAGVQPTWYVDKESVEEYRKLGLKAVVGGKLTPARNMGLDDAARKKKACVQVSDDISRWEYHHGPKATSREDDAVNAACAAAKVFVLSPVSAARFLLAKMRAAAPDAEGRTPQLAGVYPLGSCARAFGGEAFTSNQFIIGDFFVVDKSPIRFDTEMKLKEDYALTCAHIEKHGGVVRSNRMTIQAKHQTNTGGACTTRDKKGKEEQRNIAILMRRWPRAFRLNPKRPNEVIMRWPTDGNGSAPKETKSGMKKVRKIQFSKDYDLRTTATVTKWTDDTRIVYGPNAKKKGSLSFDRYKKYSKATTVGQALKFGTKRSDLLWDFDRGLLKAK